MYNEDTGHTIRDGVTQKEITEDIYAALCELKSLIALQVNDLTPLSESSLPEFLVQDVTKAEQCLTQEVYNPTQYFMRDYIVLRSFLKVLNSIKDSFLGQLIV